MADDYLEHLCEKLTDQIRSQWPSFEGHTVRADAGDPGMIYVALRGAKGEFDVAEKFSGELETLLERELDEEPEALAFAISVGSSNKDLLLQIDIRNV